jgi:transcriptional regulator with XRE-family HTH domain
MYSLMNMDEFKRWLQQEMDNRGWSISDLARSANVARGSIGNILRGERNPGIDVCEGIAHAFKISPEIVYRRAGLLPPALEQDEKRQELVHLYEMMSEDNKDDQLSYARMKLEKQEREGKNNVKTSRTAKNI